MKKKILMVSCGGLGNGGVQAVMMGIVRYFSSEYDFDMLLFTNEERFYDKEFLSFGGKILRVPYYEGNVQLRKKVDYYIRYRSLYSRVSDAIKQNGPYDVIYCNNGFESAICLKAAKNNGIENRITQAHIIYQSSNIIQRFVNGNYRRMILRYATRIIGCSDEAIISLLGGMNGATVILNPYDNKKYSPSKDTDIKRPLMLTQVGRFTDNKNQRFTIDIIREIKKRNKEVKLILIGFGSDAYISALTTYIEDNGLSENVKLFPSNTNIAELLDDCYGFVFPSKKEGFGIVLVEAQAMGIQCFVSDTVPRLADCGGCTYLSLGDGPEKWADVIIAQYAASCGTHKKYDCSRLSTDVIMSKYRQIFGE